MRPLPGNPVFTRADLRALDWSDSATSRAVRSGRLVRLRHGHFARPAGPDLTPRAAALACGGSVVSHRSATIHHGLPLLCAPPARPDLTVRPGATGDVAGALLHRAGLGAADVTVVDGVPVTTVARTVVDLARTLPVVDGVVTADAALQRGLTDDAELRDVLRRCARWPGSRRAARVLELADGRAESPLESVSRLVIRRLGLTMPQPQAVVRDARGRFAGRCDFYWDEFGVFGEADGRSKYDERTVLTAEKERQERLEDLGLVAVRWGWTDAWTRPSVLERRIRNAFERGRLRDSAGFPRNWSVDPA